MVAPLWALNTITNLCSRKKWAKVHQTFLGDASYPLRTPIMPNFIEIGQTSLEIGGGGCQLGLGQKNLIYFVTDRNVTTYVATCSVREARLKNGRSQSTHHGQHNSYGPPLPDASFSTLEQWTPDPSNFCPASSKKICCLNP